MEYHNKNCPIQTKLLLQVLDVANMLKKIDCWKFIARRLFQCPICQNLMNIIISMGFEILLKANNDDVFNDFHLLAKKI
jgi:hypothetical protein